MSDPAERNNLGAPDAEIERLRAEVEWSSRHYYQSSQQRGIDNRTRRFVIERCLPFVRGPYVLELGYVDGLWSESILERGVQLDIVEGASAHATRARERFGQSPNARVFHMLFQEYRPDRPYDTIVAGDMLQYLHNPKAFLMKAQEWLRDDGRLIVTVPNARSMHRRIGALLNLEASPTNLNATERQVGSRRTFDRYELRALLTGSGYIVEALHGCFLKPLSSAQISEWRDALLRAFLEIGDELEDYCWFLYAICRKG